MKLWVLVLGLSFTSLLWAQKSPLIAKFDKERSASYETLIIGVPGSVCPVPDLKCLEEQLKKFHFTRSYQYQHFASHMLHVKYPAPECDHTVPVGGTPEYVQANYKCLLGQKIWAIDRQLKFFRQMHTRELDAYTIYDGVDYDHQLIRAYEDLEMFEAIRMFLGHYNAVMVEVKLRLNEFSLSGPTMAIYAKLEDEIAYVESGFQFQDTFLGKLPAESPVWKSELRHRPARMGGRDSMMTIFQQKMAELRKKK